MQLYILRHGIAEAPAAGMSDADRALVPEGMKKLRIVLSWAHATGVSPTLILTSPYRRAVETAEIAAEVLDYKGEIVRSEALYPGCTPNEAWDEVRKYGAENRIVLSGHEPMLGYMTGYLLAAPSLLIDLKKGSLLRIDMEQIGVQPRGVLRWYMTPKLALRGKQ